MTGHEFLWEVDEYTLPGSLGKKYRIGLYDESWRTVGMSASFVVDWSREPKVEVWKVEEEVRTVEEGVSRGGTSRGWTIRHHGQWRNHGYSSDGRN